MNTYIKAPYAARLENVDPKNYDEVEIDKTPKICLLQTSFKVFYKEQILRF